MADAYKIIMSISSADLRDELASLEEAVRNDPRIQKIEHLRALIALYGEPEASASPATDEIDSVKSHFPRSTLPPRIQVSSVRVVRPAAQVPPLGNFQTVPKIRRFKEIAERELRKVGSMHRKDLLQVMIDEGVMGAEKDLLGAFATSMYQLKGIFESDGKGIFRLRSGVGEKRSASNEVP